MTRKQRKSSELSAFLFSLSLEVNHQFTGWYFRQLTLGYPSVSHLLKCSQRHIQKSTPLSLRESPSTQSGNKTDYPSSMNERVSALNIQNKILKTRAYINENLIHSIGKQQLKTYLWKINTIWDTSSNVFKTDRQMGREKELTFIEVKKERARYDWLLYTWLRATMTASIRSTWIHTSKNSMIREQNNEISPSANELLDINGCCCMKSQFYWGMGT